VRLLSQLEPSSIGGGFNWNYWSYLRGDLRVRNGTGGRLCPSYGKKRA
jgi:hypothetical protein